MVLLLLEVLLECCSVCGCALPSFYIILAFHVQFLLFVWMLSARGLLRCFILHFIQEQHLRSTYQVQVLRDQSLEMPTYVAANH